MRSRIIDGLLMLAFALLFTWATVSVAQHRPLDAIACALLALTVVQLARE